MIANLLLAAVIGVYFIVPTAIQWREGETRRESIALASAQFGVLLVIAGIVAGFIFFLASFA